ncbi:MAG: DUF6868 family protein [Candidatus Omnitrophota bacterium]
MTLELLREIFKWCSIINFGLFMLSIIVICSGRDWICKMHGKWYNIPEDKICVILYQVMAFYKISILIFNVIPFIVLSILT